MSDVRPFRGLRPRAELVQKVACPPYDVLSLDEAAHLAQDNPESFLHVIRAEIDLGPGADPHSQQVYEQSRQKLQEMISDKVMLQDETACFYVYRLIRDGHEQYGLVASVSLDEYENDLVKKHELTRPVKEADRAKHIEILKANAGPVLLAYRARQEIADLIQRICSSSEPVYNFAADDDVDHCLWPISSPGEITQLQETFVSVPALYIADGHHRAAAASRVREIMRSSNPHHSGDEEYNYFLAVAFPDQDLRIMGYNRVVRDLSNLSVEEFLQQVGQKFNVSSSNRREPEAAHLFSMFLDGDWYRLEARPGSFAADDPVEQLDASILQNNLLGPILGIEDPRADQRIDFVGGVRGTLELERRCSQDMRVAFCVYPVAVEQLMAVADEGLVMPPKSTWFEPKLRSGIVVRPI
ncbi:MAG: DUF1015 domain-containing protein [Deltaproteobacteria bacterium]|nr:DUF1015 domain-containing protein [Deltaproteobacteria bacterium]